MILYKDKVLTVTAKHGYLELFWHLPETASELEYLRAFCRFMLILKHSETKNILQKGDVFSEKFAKQILLDIQFLVAEIGEIPYRMASVMAGFDELDTINLMVEIPLPKAIEKKFENENNAIQWLMNIEL